MKNLSATQLLHCHSSSSLLRGAVTELRTLKTLHPAASFTQLVEETGPASPALKALADVLDRHTAEAIEAELLQYSDAVFAGWQRAAQEPEGRA
jgi:hypothetical protein